MKILEIELLSADLEGTGHFYRDIFGLRLISKEEHFISFKAGWSVLKFKPVEYLKPVYHFAFNIPCNQLNEALEWASTRFEMISASAGDAVADFSNWNAKAFYFYDNNGNILEFLARYELDNKSAKRFSADSVSCISEIAIVTDDTLDFTSGTGKDLGLSPFAKQPLLKNFAALGDDEGLLILSTAGRHWFPTEMRAEKFPVRIVLEGTLGKKELKIGT